MTNDSVSFHFDAVYKRTEERPIQFCELHFLKGFSSFCPRRALSNESELIGRHCSPQRQETEMQQGQIRGVKLRCISRLGTAGKTRDGCLEENLSHLCLLGGQTLQTATSTLSSSCVSSCPFHNPSSSSSSSSPSSYSTSSYSPFSYSFS